MHALVSLFKEAAAPSLVLGGFCVFCLSVCFQLLFTGKLECPLWVFSAVLFCSCFWLYIEGHCGHVKGSKVSYDLSVSSQGRWLFMYTYKLKKKMYIIY